MTQHSGKEMMYAWVDRSVVVLVERLIALNGVSKSEYLRQLILADLDKRSVFTTQLKADLQRTQSGEHAQEAQP